MLKASSKYLIYILLALSAVLLSLSTFIPILSLIALAPLIYIFDLYRERIINRHKLFLSIILSLVISFIFWQITQADSSFVGALFYAIWISFTFIIFWFTDRYSKNRLGYFTLSIYWLALEYSSIKVGPEYSCFSLGALFDRMPDLVVWNGTMGLLGVSLWIVISNILMYYTLFQNHAIFEGKIRWLSLIYSLLFIAVPYLLTVLWFSDLQPITQMDLFNFYNEDIELVQHSGYASRGEWVGRSAAWVSLLIILYSFVRRKIR